jgi:peptide/nickel transport system ATP-binding protein
VSGAASQPGTPPPLLEVKGLSLDIETRRGRLNAVSEVSFTVHKGEVLGLVGESGAGKSLTASAVMGLLDAPLRRSAGELRLKGRELSRLTEPEWRQVRGREVGAIFQDPLGALNPLFTVGHQLEQTLRAHLTLTGAEARRRACELLDDVGISAAAQRMGHYPHQFSGGMRQRVVIALALACGPELLIADEPTTALDVSTQAQILALIRRLTLERGMGMLLITHDLGVVAEICDRVAVMYAGRIVESGPVREVLLRPAHPYSQGLMQAMPSLASPSMKRLPQIEGAMPSLAALPQGCAFHPRCTHALLRCALERPTLLSVGEVQRACWLAPEPLPETA